MRSNRDNHVVGGTIRIRACRVSYRISYDWDTSPFDRRPKAKEPNRRPSVLLLFSSLQISM